MSSQQARERRFRRFLHDQNMKNYLRALDDALSERKRAVISQLMVEEMDWFRDAELDEEDASG